LTRRPNDAGYRTAVDAITAGRAEARPLWLLLISESDRDNHELKPSVWEGPGEYQLVQYTDGKQTLVRIPFGRPSLTRVNVFTTE
jgi:hypothetical protein